MNKLNITSERIILDLGCGNRKLLNSIGVDIDKRFVNNDTDVIADLNDKLPFKDESVDLIVTSHTLEHLEDISFTMKELYRILKINGRIKIWLPHVSQASSIGNWTHKRHATSGSFDRFHHLFEINKVEINFARNTTRYLKLLNKLINPCINLSKSIYEKFFCWILPSEEVYFELRKKKIEDKKLLDSYFKAYS